MSVADAAAAATDTTAADAAAAAAAATTDVNYELPTNGRADTSGAEDGDSPGAPSAKTETTETTEEAAARASEAGRELAGRGRSLRDDLVAERATSKALKAELESNRQLIEAWRPLLERLDGRPDLQQALLDGKVTIQQAEAAKARDDAAELTAIANDFDWIKADGSPDLDKAAKHLERLNKTADARVAARVQPIEHQSNQTRAAAQVDVAVAYATENKHADPEFVRAEFAKIAREKPASLLNQQEANALYHMVIGRAITQGKTFKAAGTTTTTTTAREAAREPDFVHTEHVGAPAGGGPRLTPQEKALGEQYGLTDADWNRGQEHVGIRKGYSRLED